ncbi:MAG: hypothetical protein K0R36_567 [Chryseobacterium sp.]|jgi:hypothetical protein|nr:hypothetical protein [Chryseobacterium sp.]
MENTLEENENYGKATIGFGTPEQKELNIVEFLQAEYKDNRLMSVVMLEDESFIFSVENPVSSGRAPHQSMRLGKESAIGMLSTILLYFNAKLGEEGMQEAIKEASVRNEINYSTSKNFKLKSE